HAGIGLAAEPERRARADAGLDTVLHRLKVAERVEGDARQLRLHHGFEERCGVAVAAAAGIVGIVRHHQRLFAVLALARELDHLRDRQQLRRVLLAGLPGEIHQTLGDRPPPRARAVRGHRDAGSDVADVGAREARADADHQGLARALEYLGAR